MKKEYLQNLGLKGDVIDKIIAEHTRITNEVAIEAITVSSGAKAPEVLRTLIGNVDAEEAKTQIAQLKGEYPWLFKGACPIFSAHSENDGEIPDPFRYGAGI